MHAELKQYYADYHSSIMHCNKLDDVHTSGLSRFSNQTLNCSADSGMAKLNISFVHWFKDSHLMVWRCVHHLQTKSMYRPTSCQRSFENGQEKLVSNSLFAHLLSSNQP